MTCPHCESIDGCCVCEGLRCYESDHAERVRDSVCREAEALIDSGRVRLCGRSAALEDYE